MASVVGPPVEVISLSISPISPLTFAADTVEAIIETARSKIAFAPLPCPIAGLTAPFSIVGAIAQQNAEILASVVLAELVSIRYRAFQRFANDLRLCPYRRLISRMLSPSI
jgi:trimethylamine--corrinoid protein Co-methyltransferase